MHELSIAQSMVELVEEAARGRRVRRIALEIGVLSGVMSEAIAFCFDIVAEGTPAEGAVLDINEIPAVARCDTCGTEFECPSELAACGCGSYRLTYLRGREIKVKSIELDVEAV